MRHLSRPDVAVEDSASSFPISPPLLILFDIDGTLLVDDAYAHGRAMISAMRSVYDVDPGDDGVERTGPWGKTDLRIAREALSAAGLDDERIDAGLEEWIQAAGEAFLSEVAASSEAWSVRPGLLTALEQLSGAGMRLTCLTGNLRAIATAKIERMGVARQFDLAIGAYADDAEERTALVPIARRRAGAPSAPWPREMTAVVGDTPGDLAAAHADAVASIVFSSARYPPAALTGADAVISDFDELTDTLAAWQEGTTR